MDLRLDLSYEAFWSARPTYKVKQSPEIPMLFLLKIYLGSIKTLAMQPVAHHNQNEQFTRSNEPRSRLTPNFTNIHISYGPNCSPQPQWPIYKVKRAPEKVMPHILPIFVFYSPRDFMVTPNSDVIFSKNLHGPTLRPKIWSQLVTTAKTVKLQDQTFLGEGKPPILPIFMCYSPQDFMVTRTSELWSQLITTAKTAHLQCLTILGIGKPPILSILVCYNSLDFLVTQIFEVNFAKNLHGPLLRPELWSQWVTTAKTDHLEGQTNPGAVTWTSVKTLVVNPVGHHDQNIPFIRSNDPRSSYGANWSPRPKQPIYKVKRSPEQSTRFYGDQKFRRHFCQKFTRISIKTLAKESVSHHGQNVSFTRSNDPRSSPWDFMLTQNSDVIFAKILHGPPLRP
ncbi:hypothetical protein H5410_029299 [Solanum commersonii]|uniref:Uncharacterized protein n=1 Tax=Solanum commersonii TaxID=4109 RepID=A0A9J5Z7C8_SOLCO|nr:hypothetical protein H5410_029299 [Solanum commersonii]